jgi:hypothetical protein
METPNTRALVEQWKTLGKSPQDIVRAFRSFNAYADAFRKESDAHE